jgi:hypothetical protein
MSTGAGNGGTTMESNSAWCRSSSSGRRAGTRPLEIGLPAMRRTMVRVRDVLGMRARVYRKKT